MITFEGKKYSVRFYDHTPDRIKSLLGTRSADDPAKAILGNHPGTLCVVYEAQQEMSIEHDRTTWRYMMVGHGVSKVFQGKRPQGVDFLTISYEDDKTLPPDTYRKKEGHPRSLKLALVSMGFTRQQRTLFFDAWHGIYLARQGRPGGKG